MGQLMGELEAALTLKGGNGEPWRGRADPLYEGANSLYGGLTAALLLKAVMSEDKVQGTPSALTVSFVRPLPPGSDIVVRTRLLGGSRSIQHWTAELSIGTANEVCAAATIVMVTRRQTDGFIEPAMPVVEPPDENLPALNPPSGFGRQSPIRYALGTMITGSSFGKSHSALWIREISGRKIDALQLAYLCDNSPPRAFYTPTGVRPSATIIYSVYFVATAEEVAEIGDDYTLMDVIGTRAVNGTVGSRANLWSRSGRLLATSEQLCWFR